MTNGVVLWILKTNNLWLLLEGSCYSFFENKVHVTLNTKSSLQTDLSLITKKNNFKIHL